MHLHDLRHTGNTLAAETGATLRELMDRMVTAARNAGKGHAGGTNGQDADYKIAANGGCRW